VRWAAALLVAALLAPLAAAQSVDQTAFRYVRDLDAPEGLVTFEPDGPLVAHAKADLADLRILDSAEQQVPWRMAPAPDDSTSPLPVLFLNRGTRGERAVALLDLGANPGIHDRLVLEIPDTDFVGRVAVRGSAKRQGPFTFLSTTVIYDIAGAPPARSTTAVYRPSDFRFLTLSATGVSAIDGATVFGGRTASPELLERPLRDLSASSQGRTTVATADLGFRNMPVDELRIRAATKLYDRPVRVEGSNSRETWAVVAEGRVYRFPGSAETTIPLQSRNRFLRLTIENGDDPPLEDLRVEALARPRTVLVAEGYRPPYRLLYGSSRIRPPQYDFAQAPLDRRDLASAAAASFGREGLNPAWEPPEDTRSFFARHPAVITAVLALAAVVLFFGAFLALRRRTDRPNDH
jgi:hypothetical protein